MVRVMAIVLMLLVGSAFGTSPADAAPADGPKLKGLFSKKGKSKGAFRKAKKKTKYYQAAAKKQRKAKWQRHRMVQ